MHRSVTNWSDSEAASLAVAVQQAQAFCHARPAASTASADLLGLARLCALGQQWPAVLEATSRLLATLPTPPDLPTGTAALSAGSASPHAQALAFRIEAALNLQDPASALAAGHTLLATEPYTALSQQTTDTLLRYLQLIQTGDALNLASQRLDRILPLLRLAGTVSTATAPTQPAAAQPQPAQPAADIPSAHELYTAALVAPTLLQLEDNQPAAARVMASVEAAVPTHLSPDEQALVNLARRQYALLGSPLPHIPASVSLMVASETPRINTAYGTATVLLLFPDWCAQCVRMGSDFFPFLTRHAGEDVHLYGLLAGAPPPAVAAPAPAPNRRTRAGQPTPPEPAHRATSAGLLRGTPTLVVAPDLPLSLFAATDFPLLLVTDHEGRIRFAQVAPENAFVPGSLVDQLVARIAELWPPPTKP